MKKKTILILGLLVVIFLVAGGIYQRPAGLTQLYPGLNLDSCKRITAYYSADETGADSRVEFPAGSEDFGLLMEQLQDQKFRKSFRSFFPSGTKSHRWTEGDFRWELILELEDAIPGADGSAATGTLFHLTNFFGDLTLYDLARDRSISCHAAHQQQWAEDILHILSGENAST